MNEEYEKFDIEKLRASMPPAVRRNHDRYMRVYGFWVGPWMRAFPWMRHPFLVFITSFWTGVIEKPIDTLTPRWGGLTFGWLNDGMKPTIWHTVRQLTHDQADPYTGLYARGAPHSLREAQAWDRELEIEREQREQEIVLLDVRFTQKPRG